MREEKEIKEEIDGLKKLELKIVKNNPEELAISVNKDIEARIETLEWVLEESDFHLGDIGLDTNTDEKERKEVE